MSRNWKLFIRDMQHAGARIRRYVAERDQASFLADEMAFDATLRNLEILGEAAKAMPQEIRARYPDVDWRAIAGLRDVLAHAYFALDGATLWDIVQNKVPTLLAQLERIQEGSED